MFKRILLASVFGLVIGQAGSQTTYTQQAVGAMPSKQSVSDLQVKCVYSGITNLTIGQILLLPCDKNGNLAVDAVTIPSVAPTTDVSNTIGTGGTFQVIAVANTARKSIEFVNICNVVGSCTTQNNMCYLFLAATGSPNKTTNAIPVSPGWSYARFSGTIPSDAIQGTCDGTGDHYRLAVQ